MSTRTTWLLDPLDTLFFREGRAFEAGEPASVRSVFPPPPSALQGMVRSRLLADHCGLWSTYANGCQGTAGQCGKYGTCQIRHVVGQRAAPGAAASAGALRVFGPWLTMEAGAGRRWLLPTPSDVVASSDELAKVRDGVRVLRTVTVLEPRPGNAPAKLPDQAMRLLKPPDDWEGSPFGPVGGWMVWERATWEAYLSGRSPHLELGATWFADDLLWSPEHRAGVKIDRERNRAQDHNLYFAEHTRIRNYPHVDGQYPRVRLAYQCEGIPEHLIGAMAGPYPAGGEMRAGLVERSSDDPPWSVIPRAVGALVDTSRRLKVVLLQPAFFSEGWRPSSAGAFDGWTLVSAAVNRPVPVGGWDLAQRREKRVRPYVPAGSVFYFTSTGTTAPAATLWDHCVSETPVGESVDLSSIGYGHAMAGTWGSDVQ